jgi:hypothetical protein
MSREKRRAGIMCETCDLIEKEIRRYQRLSKQVGDERLLEAADRLVKELKVKKQRLHSGNDGD